MGTHINFLEIVEKAKSKGHIVEQQDVLYAFVYNLIDNKTQSYQLTHDCSKITEANMRIKVNAYQKTPKIEYLVILLKPVVSNIVREYFLGNSGEFMDILNSKMKPTIDVPKIGDEYIGDVDELSDLEIKKLASQCVRALPAVLNTGNPDDIKNSITVLATYLKHFVEKKEDEQNTVVVVTEKYTGVCPHCNKEY